jgi:hypothetical protein
MRKNQNGHTPRGKLARDLDEQIRIRKLPWGSPERDAAIKRWVTRRLELSAADVKRRNERWLAMGSPELTSPVWQAELVLLKAKERKRKPRVLPPNTDPNDPNSLHRELVWLTARQAAGVPVELRKLPGQYLEGKSREERAAAARLYRWLWRNFPGALEACDDELRELIRRSGGVA